MRAADIAETKIGAGLAVYWSATAQGLYICFLTIQTSIVPQIKRTAVLELPSLAMCPIVSPASFVAEHVSPTTLIQMEASTPQSLN